MKMKITDLMDLYEDRRAGAAGVPGRGAQYAPADAEAPGRSPQPSPAEGEEPVEIRQRRRLFGWEQALSLAAVLALLVLGGFGIKWLLSPRQTPAAPSEAGTTQAAPSTAEGWTEVKWYGWEWLEGEDREQISRLLTCLAQQQIDSLSADLSNDGSLIHFAFVWRRNYDCEAIEVLEAPDGLCDTLTPAQVNETLERLLGKSVQVPEALEAFDYSSMVGAEQGSLYYRDGRLWDHPLERDTSLRFALAALYLPDMDYTRMEAVQFTVYEVNLLLWPDAKLDDLPALSTAEAEAMVGSGRLRMLRTGTAELELTADGYRLKTYETKPYTQPTPAEDGPISSEPESRNGEDSPENLVTTPTGWPTVSREDWTELHRLLSAWVREEVSLPAGQEGGDRQQFFAMGLYCNGTLETSLEVPFQVFRADLEAWPEYLDLDPAELDWDSVVGWAQRGFVTWVGDGTAVFEKRDGRIALVSGDCFFYAENDPVGSVDPDALESAELDALKAELEAAFSDERSWNVRTLTGAFTSPLYMDLSRFFYDGIPGVDNTLSEAERTALEALGAELELDCDRLPRTEIDRVLEETFGVGLDYFAKRGLDRFYYLEQTDCWYHVHSDTELQVGGVEILDVRIEADGDACSFLYRARSPLHPSAEAAPIWTAVVTLTEKGGCRLCANLPGVWMTPEALGLGAAFYLSDAAWQCETAEADGTRTVRRLDFRTDGSLTYREGDPNSEFSTWYTGSWWFQNDLLCFELWPGDENGNRTGPAVTPTYACAFESTAITLTQVTEAGLGGGAEVWTALRLERMED